MRVQTFDRSRPKILVVSHERSGTHFLMNSLAACYGYVSAPWVNLDYELGLNFFHPATLAQFFGQFRDVSLANLVKSHHPFSFFEEAFAAISIDFHVLYIYRDPRDVMVSYWKFLNRLGWNEGPKTETCSQFVRSEPCGQMMRYQARQEISVIHRWRTHVEGWTAGVPEPLRGRVTCLRFADLSQRYEQTMLGLAAVMGEEPRSLARPSLHENTILPSRGAIGSHREHFNDEDLALFRDLVGPTMSRLGCDAG